MTKNNLTKQSLPRHEALPDVDLPDRSTDCYFSDCQQATHLEDIIPAPASAETE